MPLVAGEVRYYTVEEAARMLRLTPERVRQMLEDGEIEGIATGAGSGWKIPIHGTPGAAPPAPEMPPAPPPMEPATERVAGVQETADEPSPQPATEPVSAHTEHRELPEEPGEPGLPPATQEETRQPAELPRGDAAAINRETTSASGWVTTQQAARALGISARTVRWHIERGNLEAKPEGEGVERAWRVSVDSLQAFRDSRQTAAPLPQSSRALAVGSDIAAVDPGNAIRELADRLVEEARRAEAARVRLELSERAQSTLEAELSEERRRREEAERARDAAQRELAALEEARKKAAVEPAGASPAGASQSAVVGSEEASTAEAAAGALRPPESHQETAAAPGLGSGGVGGGLQRQGPRRWWRRWRRS